MYTICKKFTFECSHRLLNLPYESLCKSLHGHSYICEIKIQSDKLNNNDMVLDFSLLKPIINKIMEYYDHATIIDQNDKELINFCNQNNQKLHIIFENFVTAEVMAEDIYHIITLCGTNVISENMKVIIELNETANNKVIFEKPKSQEFTQNIKEQVKQFIKNTNFSKKSSIIEEEYDDEDDDEEYEDEDVMDTFEEILIGWKCPICKTINSPYKETCSCSEE